MKLSVIALLALGGVVSAQPVEPGPGTTDVQPVQPPPPQPVQPPPQPVVVQPPPPMHHHEMADPDDHRPTDLAFAIGIGYARPPGGGIDLQTPNIASARLRLLNGVTFEPTVVIANTSNTTSAGTTDVNESITELDLGTLVRFPVIRHGRVDFEVLGSIGIDVVKDDPDGDYNTKTTTTFGLGWGIGIGYWLSPHWQLSASATNPLFTYASTKQDTGPDTSTKDSGSTFAVQFNPTTTIMIHLYN
ncbi:MAG: outer membrane beta-barrel protein [Kofleriaceae bacterium]